MTERTQIGRIALRQEGAMWNAYYALNDTMDGAIMLGSIAIAAIENNAVRKQAFMAMMREVVAEIIMTKDGIRPSWGTPKPARERKRFMSGTARINNH